MFAFSHILAIFLDVIGCKNARRVGFDGDLFGVEIMLFDDLVRTHGV